MESVYEWIRNLTGFFLFMSVLDNLIPGKRYGRYIRLFAGMILILLVLQPFTGSLRLQDRIARYYGEYVFRYEADDLKQEILGVEKQRLNQIIRQYEKAVAVDVTQMAEESGLMVRSCKVEIGQEEGTETFGCVTGIRVAAALTEESGENDEPVEETSGMRAEQQREEAGLEHPVEPVRPVEVGKAGEERAAQEPVPPAAERLRRRLASYYDLEEAYVEVQVVER